MQKIEGKHRNAKRWGALGGFIIVLSTIWWVSFFVSPSVAKWGCLAVGICIAAQAVYLLAKRRKGG